MHFFVNHSLYFALNFYVKDILTSSQTTILVGDFNLCMIDERKNGIIKFLEEAGYSQHVLEATHLLGGHIDHVYSNHDPSLYSIDVLLYCPYYTCKDHDALLVTIKKVWNYSNTTNHMHSII